jgi:hypothetical protein
MKTKEITVNGINLVLYRLGAMEQQNIFNKYVLPVAATLGECFTSGANNAEIAAKIPASLMRNMPPEKIQELLFKVLLSPDCVKIKAAGMEMPLVSQEGARAVVTSSELDEIAYCWEIAIEVFKLNFENLFTYALTTFQSATKSAVTSG